MPANNLHLTDQELILAADGELDTRRASQVRAHLDACWSCRARHAEFANAVSEYVRFYRDHLDPQVPPAAGPRALLKAQLERASASARPGKLAAAFAAVFAGSLAAMVLYIGVSNLRASDLSVPKNGLTPGETRNVTFTDLCRVDRHQRADDRTYPGSMQHEVFHEYGIANARPNAYEVDYLITPELGGADSIRNLWPEPYSITWNAHVKDELENRLHDLVCERKLDLATAQREIATDWIGTYKKYFHTDRPL